MPLRKIYQLAAIFCVVSICFAQQPPAQPPKLNLVVVEGEGAINNVRLRTSRETIVQVEDENHRPIAGAAVVFLLPNNGPGGTFINGSNSVAVTTDAAGRAAMPPMQPNSTSGPFQIRVHASYRGQEANTVINQSIAAGAPVAPAHAGGISGKTIGIIVGVVAAGAVGAAVGLKGGGGGGPQPQPNPTTPPSGTISVGSGAVLGPPR